jgi:hypothetical protein
MNRALQLVAFHWRPGDTRQMHALIAFLGASRAQGRAATQTAAFRKLCTAFMQTLQSEHRP